MSIIYQFMKGDIAHLTILTHIDTLWCVYNSIQISLIEDP